MRGSNFSNAKIRDSMWIMTDMRGANFDRASLHRCDMTMGKWDDTTNFPPGFDPTHIENRVDDY